eukprot:COSAG01_NODE_36_length_34092_cov_26.350032_26_plen_173_part_00
MGRQPAGQLTKTPRPTDKNAPTGRPAVAPRTFAHGGGACDLVAASARPELVHQPQQALAAVLGAGRGHRWRHAEVEPAAGRRASAAAATTAAAALDGVAVVWIVDHARREILGVPVHVGAAGTIAAASTRARATASSQSSTLSLGVSLSESAEEHQEKKKKKKEKKERGHSR